MSRLKPFSNPLPGLSCKKKSYIANIFKNAKNPANLTNFNQFRGSFRNLQIN